MPTRVRSCCKINLGLAIGPPRPDGFHALTTLYQTLALHDVVSISARPAPVTSIVLASNHPGVPTDDTNTAWKMVAGALERPGHRRRGGDSHPEKLAGAGGHGGGVRQRSRRAHRPGTRAESVT